MIDTAGIKQEEVMVNRGHGPELGVMHHALYLDVYDASDKLIEGKKGEFLGIGYVGERGMVLYAQPAQIEPVLEP